LTENNQSIKRGQITQNNYSAKYRRETHERNAQTTTISTPKTAEWGYSL